MMTPIDFKENVKEIIKKQILDDHPNSNNFIVPYNLSKKSAVYMSMREDLVLCLKTLLELKKLVEEGVDDSKQHILTALWNSMIIVYAKCYTDASTARKSKLEINEILKNDKQDLIDIHNHIMSIRHTFIAHRGDNENEQAIVFFSQPKMNDGRMTTEYHIKSLRANNFGIDNLLRCETLFSVVLDHIKSKLTVELTKVHSHIMTLDQETLKTWLIKNR